MLKARKTLDYAAIIILTGITFWDVRVGVLSYVVYVLARRILADWRTHECEKQHTLSEQTLMAP